MKFRLRIVLFTSTAISLTIELIDHLTCMISCYLTTLCASVKSDSGTWKIALHSN